MQRWWKLWMAVLFSTLLAACGGGDDDGDDRERATPATSNVVEVAAAQGFNALLAAATKADLAAALSAEDASLTVFAPTDEAFTALATTLGFADATAMVEALPASALATILQYHVLPAEQKAADLIAGGTTQATLLSVGGTPVALTVDTTSGVKLTDELLTQASVTTADVPASNGVIHVIDKVLVPPGVLNVVQMAQLNPVFSSLVSAVVRAGLAPTLGGDGPFTVFAPTNDAFTALATTLGFANAGAMIDALSPTQLAQILQYHVLGSQKTAADLIAGGATQPTLLDFHGAKATLTVDTTSGVKLTDEVLTQASVTAADVQASNGVIHVIDKVLVPPGVLNVVQMAQLNPIFSSLVGAVVSADLATTLSGPGPFTVFAPVNDAFAAIASTVAGLSVEQLTTVLTYHVLDTQVLAADIPFGSAITTLAHQSITIHAGTPPTITDTTATPAPIVATDVNASNGVIHVIGKVLIPHL